MMLQVGCKKAPLLTKEGCHEHRFLMRVTGWFSNFGRRSYNPDQMPFKRSKTDLHTLPELHTFRTELRKNLTPAEARFWTMVKNSQLEGRRFRRQHSVGRYILDFYCPSERLGIELDGDGHFNEAARDYDYERKLFLRHFGIKVIRFENKMVFEEEERVIYRIRESFGWQERTTPPAEAAATPPS